MVVDSLQLIFISFLIFGSIKAHKPQFIKNSIYSKDKISKKENILPIYFLTSYFGKLKVFLDLYSAYFNKESFGFHVLDLVKSSDRRVVLIDSLRK